MQKLKKKFTKWYFEKGYGFGYDYRNEAVFVCPLWVKPLLFLFSPSIYVHDLIGWPYGGRETFRIIVDEMHEYRGEDGAAHE